MYKVRPDALAGTVTVSEALPLESADKLANVLIGGVMSTMPHNLLLIEEYIENFN